jgi:hypothetical protein
MNALSVDIQGNFGSEPNQPLYVGTTLVFVIVLRDSFGTLYSPPSGMLQVNLYAPAMSAVVGEVSGYLTGGTPVPTQNSFWDLSTPVMEIAAQQETLDASPGVWPGSSLNVPAVTAIPGSGANAPTAPQVPNTGYFDVEFDTSELEVGMYLMRVLSPLNQSQVIAQQTVQLTDPTAVSS